MNDIDKAILFLDIALILFSVRFDSPTLLCITAGLNLGFAIAIFQKAFRGF